jgi:hypothetical protein
MQLGCSPRQVNEMLTAKEKAEMIAFLIVEDGASVVPEIIEAMIEQKEFAEHEAAAKAHFNMT